MISFKQYIEESKGLADKAKKSGISLGTLKKVYKKLYTEYIETGYVKI